MWFKYGLKGPKAQKQYALKGSKAQKQYALKGQKLLAQGIRPGYSCPHAWRPVGAKALYGDPNMIQYCVKLTFNRL